MAGRKSLKEELKIFERYSELSIPYFRVLKKKLESDADPAAQMWAVEQLTKAFVKMIPQTLDGTGEGGEIKVAVTNYGNITPVQLSTEAVPTSVASSNGQRNEAGGSDMA
jgi:hypothetical protein